MDKELVLTMCKEDIKYIVNNLDIEGLTTDLCKIKNYISFLENLPDLNDTPQSEQNSKNIPEKAISNAHEENGPTEEKLHGYKMERKLKGGYIKELEAYIPEKIIRQLDLHDGDLVQAIPKVNESFGQKKQQHYHYKLIQKGKGINPNRTEFKYCVVEKDSTLNSFICNRYLSGETIRIQDMPYSILINSNDVEDFKITDGDIIDIAVAKDNSIYHRVVWKHEIDDDHISTPLPAGYYKEKETVQNAIEEKVLKGKTITVIGCIDRQSIYRDRLTSLGASFQAIDGKEDETRLSSTIKRSDIVMIIIPAVSHQGALASKKFCKEFNVPFQAIDSIGTTALVSAVLTKCNEIEYTR